MKFKKSISFVLTLCMVLSLFATFVIPASAEATNVALNKEYTISGCGERSTYYAKLTDGVAKTALSYNHDEWFGFYCNGTDASIINAPDKLGYVVIDLGASYDIHSVSVNFVDNAGGSGISAPTAVNAYLSADGETWSDAVALTIPAETTKGVAYAVEGEVSGNARYVKVDVGLGGTFAFLNEIEVYGTEAAPKAGLAGKNVSQWAAGSDFAVLTDGYNGVGEVNNYNPYQSKLFGVASGVMEATDYTLTFVIDKAEFNTITLYALDFANGGVMLPEAVTFVVDGVKYEAAINANANGIATIVATLDEAVTANCVVAEVTMGASPYSFTIFNMFTEFEVSNELPEDATVIEYLGYIHAAHSMVAYAEADMTLGELVAKYLGQSKDLNYCKVAICDADGTVKAVYLTLGREPAEGPNGVKTNLTIAAGQFAVIYNANKTGHEVMDSINVGDTITLYNVDALKTHTGTAVALTNAGFTVKAAPKSEIVLPEDVQGFGDPYAGVDVLVDGDTAAGKFDCFYGNQAYLVAVMNTNAEANAWDVTIALKEKTTFNTVTVYYWDEANSCIQMPATTEVTVNGKTYPAVANTTESVVGGAGKVHAVVVDLGEEVTASSYTVTSTMVAEQANFFNMMTEIAVSLVGEDDESYKETHTHVDGDKVGTIQQLGDAWADKLTLDFWYLVEDGETTVTVNYAVDNKVVLDDDTMFRVWVDADITDTARTTLYDYKVSAGEAYNAKHASSINEAIVSAEYTVVGNDYFFTLVLDKATLGIDGEYRLNLQLGQSTSTTMHSIKYDNVTGEGATYAPWNTTEFYEVFGKAPEVPVTSQVVTEWNAADWQVTATGANGAYVFTDAEIYATGNQTWWIHASFKPTTIAGVYEIAAIRYASGDAAFLEIPEGGFVWAAHDSAAAGTAGAFAYAFMKAAKVGERVIITGVDFAAQTTKADATLTYVTAAADMDLIVSHNYNYSWHCFETQIITMAVGEAGLKKAGDAPNMTAEDTDILYIVENVDGAYLVTGVVGGKALLDVEIPENGFLYYVTKNCTGYDKICHGELVGKYLLLGDIDLATKFAIDPKVNPAYTMKAVSGFKTGDADLDGKITATDYAIIRKLVLGTLTAEDVGELVLKTADVNGNGKVDARDYYLAKRAFLGTYVIPGWEAEDAE